MAQPPESIAELQSRIATLEKENRFLNHIIHKAPIPLFVLDEDHRISHFNESMVALTGLTAEEMAGTDGQWKAFYNEKRPVMADLLIDHSSTDEILSLYGSKFRSPDENNGAPQQIAGTDFFPDLGPEGRWLFFTAAALTNEKGEITGAVETLQDVTPEKEKKAALEKLSRTYSRVLEFIPYPIIVYDENVQVTYVNPAFTRKFGWELEEIKGCELPYIPDELTRENQEMMVRFQQQKKIRFETQRLTRDGMRLDVVLWGASHSTPGPDQGVEHFVILRDVTEEKRLAANNRALMRISQALPEYPGLHDLMDYITREVRDLLEIQGAVVLLHDEIKQELFFLGAAYDDARTERRAREVRFALDEVLAGKVLKTGRPAMINTADAALEAYPERDRKLGYQTRSILCAPIKSEGRITGVLCAINKKTGRFNDNDLERMTLIAGTVGISIENARFSQAVQEALRGVAAMNRAKDKAINHLSHELKTPVAVLNGSLQILRKKLVSHGQIKVEPTLKRIQRNLDRIMEIQEETADIMENKVYRTRDMLLKMLAVCKDELETLLEEILEAPTLPEDPMAQIRSVIEREFGHRSLDYDRIVFEPHFNRLYPELARAFQDRDLDIRIDMEPNLPPLKFPGEVLNKVITGLIKNAVENTPDQGRIEIRAHLAGPDRPCPSEGKSQGSPFGQGPMDPDRPGICFSVKDFGVGILERDQQQIFEGFFSTQETLDYATRAPYTFNAGGKGADLLRMKLFGHRLGFEIAMASQRCGHLLPDPKKEEQFTCPGQVQDCPHCEDSTHCLGSGFSIFSVFLPVKT